MKRKTSKRLVILLVVAALVLSAAGAGWYFLSHRALEPVNVFSFQYLGMTEFWGDSQESYGPVTTDRIQTVFLSETQTVTEILVAPGDTVKKGDLLIRFDTTLTDIALERERLKVEKLKLDLENAKDRLKEINKMKPMVIPSYTPSEPEEDKDLGVAISGPYQVSTKTDYDGSTQELAMICWLAADTKIDNTLFSYLYDVSAQYRAENLPQTPPESADPTDPTETTESTEPAADPNRFFVVFKVTEKDMSLGSTRLYQGLQVTRNSGGGYSFQFFDASSFPDHTLAVPETPDSDYPQIDFGSGYTASQIAQMRSEQEKLIRDLEFQVKMAEADYQIKLKETDDGCVYAEIDGTVVSLLTPEEAFMMGQPLLKVSGGGGFYVEGAVSELAMDSLQIGQEVTINDWNTGMTYIGTVESIGSLPVAMDYYTGIGNPNVSYYPFTVFVDGSADLQAGSYVSVIYSAAAAENGIYLENAFIRTENGKSFVFVMGQDGLLEKRYITVGKSLWGSYTEILEGITAEDFIAFPYGKNVVEGAPAVEAEIQALYE